MNYKVKISLCHVFAIVLFFQPKYCSAQTSSLPVVLKAEQYAKLNAMLVIGSSISIDSSIVNLGKYLRNLGVNVYEFYHPNAIWTDMISVDKPIHIFVYAGHGTKEGEYNRPGGLVISKPEFISSHAILTDLPLAKNALVLLQSVCLSAGSSADDESNISLTSAIFRIENYSKPFIEKGAAAYYAVSFNNGLKPFLEKFFSGTPAKEIYKDAFSHWCDVQAFNSYSFNRIYEVSVASKMPKQPLTQTSIRNGVKVTKQVGPFISYDKAFVGRSTFSVLDFFE